MRNKFLGTGEHGYSPIRKLRVCVSGLRYAVFYDFSVAWKLGLSLAVLGLFGYLYQWVDFLIVFVATALMLIAEMFNTTTEALCDFIEPREDKRIGAIKDIAAAAAGISIVVWVIVLAAELVQFFQSAG
ncbi:MAG: diacylglycerol kinase [Candidatus Hydrogenedentes bacterium]|nr:diacylglycerol kinase [Candidatus Hydrogenedentota bacterium]